MVVAAIAKGRESDLRAVLDSMNSAPGVADPRNALLPFGQFDRLHFARLVVLEDATLVDYAAHGMQAPNFPKQLVFMGDCDGPSQELLANLSQRAGAGLRRIFAHCEDFDAGGDLLAWMNLRCTTATSSSTRIFQRRLVRRRCTWSPFRIAYSGDASRAAMWPSTSRPCNPADAPTQSPRRSRSTCRD